MEIKESGEMYLETILRLLAKNDKIRSIDVAEAQNYSKPSVSRAMGILRDNGFVEVDGGGFIHLTDKGRERAEKIYERHTFLTRVLTQIGVNPKTAEDDACKVEHFISDETFEKIKKVCNKLEEKANG